MDYARFNYVAQPTDNGVAMEPPFLGVYDYYALEWAYRVFPHSKSYKDDIAPLNKLVEAHANDPIVMACSKRASNMTILLSKKI